MLINLTQEEVTLILDDIQTSCCGCGCCCHNSNHDSGKIAKKIFENAIKNAQDK